jgi:excinuclease ABC subunit B
MGRAARNIKGEVIMYADRVTDSMKNAIEEIRRRRDYQLAYNQEHGITPTTIIKGIREKLVESDDTDNAWQKLDDYQAPKLMKVDLTSLTPRDKERLIKRLEREMKAAADNLQFETAIALRDHLKSLRGLSSKHN